jgi:hypothetical protein
VVNFECHTKEKAQNIRLGNLKKKVRKPRHILEVNFKNYLGESM